MTVDLQWIPLGAGQHVVRVNGVIYEAILAAIEHRERRALYHSMLRLTLSHGEYTVEMTPVPDAEGASRGVVAEGPVGLRVAGRFRLFRYEVRRWRDGIVPDLVYAVHEPQRVTDDPERTRAVFDQLAAVPTPTWGRDELDAGEMWSCNSIIAWALVMAGVDVDAVALPPGGRAPGWDAGVLVARRMSAARTGAAVLDTR